MVFFGSPVFFSFFLAATRPPTPSLDLTRWERASWSNTRENSRRAANRVNPASIIPTFPRPWRLFETSKGSIEWEFSLSLSTLCERFLHFFFPPPLVCSHFSHRGIIGQTSLPFGRFSTFSNYSANRENYDAASSILSWKMTRFLIDVLRNRIEFLFVVQWLLFNIRTLNIVTIKTDKYCNDEKW